MKKIPASKEGNAFKHTLDLALEEKMHADPIPEVWTENVVHISLEKHF